MVDKVLYGMRTIYMNTEESYEQEVCHIIKTHFDRCNINQTEFVKRCIKNGYHITQGSISRVLAGKKKISVEEMRAFCDVLKIPAEVLLFPNMQRFSSEEDFFLLPEREIESVDGVLGDYDIYFMSTAKEENDVMNQGTLRLFSGNNCVHAEVEISLKDSTSKKYRGYLWIAEQGTVAYVIVKRMPEGEISVVAFRYRKFEKKSMRCRSAVCLTTSAGEKKDPVFHYLALIRAGAVTEEVRERLAKELQKELRKSPSQYLEVEGDMDMYQWLSDLGEVQYE